MSSAKSQFKPATKDAPFSSLEVATRLEAAKSAAIAADQAAAEAAGVEWEETPLRWWNDVLVFEWASARQSGDNGTKWAGITYRGDTVSGRLILRVNGEKHIGQIMPSTDAGVAELVAQSKNPNIQIKKRDRKPTLQFQRWRDQVKTAADGVTLLVDAEGNPVLPSDKSRSNYYRVAALVNEAFLYEAAELLKCGAALAAMVTEMKKTPKGAATAQAIADTFAKSVGGRRPGDMILGPTDLGVIRGLFPDARSQEILTSGAIIATNTKLVSLVQEYISSLAKKNAGMPLPNPMTRVALNFDATTGLPKKMAIHDAATKFTGPNGRSSYELAKVDGELVNDDNIHKFITSHSMISGIINMDSVCFSSMGISIPVKAEVLVVAMATRLQYTVDDVFDVDDDGGVVVAAPAPSPARAVAAVKAAAKTAVVEAVEEVEEGEVVEDAEADEADAEAEELPVVAAPPVKTKAAAAAAKPAAAPAAKAAAPVAKPAAAPIAKATATVAKPAATVAKAAAPVAKTTAPVAKPAAKKAAAAAPPPAEEDGEYADLLDDLAAAE